MAETPLPCPVCKSKRVTQMIHAAIVCGKCGIRLEPEADDSYAEVTERWNRLPRPLTPPTDDRRSSLSLSGEPRTMTRKLLLIVGCAMLSGCEARVESSGPIDQPLKFPRERLGSQLRVYVDSLRHVGCYSLQVADGDFRNISCVALDSTNSHAIDR